MYFWGLYTSFADIFYILLIEQIINQFDFFFLKIQSTLYIIIFGHKIGFQCNPAGAMNYVNFLELPSEYQALAF